MSKRIFRVNKSILIVAEVVAVVAVALTAGVFIGRNFKSKQNKQLIISKYIDVKLADIHNHDAERNKYKRSMYPDRFFLSSDSGYDLDGGLAQAYEACYRLLDELDDEAIAKKIAYESFHAILQAMPATKTQLEALKSLGSKVTDHYDLSSINKYQAGRILAENNYKFD